jgi:FkbM family methyltransferase
MKHLSRIINYCLSFLGIRITGHATLKSKIRRGDFKWLQERNIATVLDIGANIGQFAQFINKILPHARIHSFEPLQDQYRQLEQLRQMIPLLQCYPFAVGSENNEMEINANEFSASSSLLPMTELHTSAFPFTKHTAAQKVQVRTLDSMMTEIKPEKNIMLKIDVQGFELEVLKGSGSLLHLVDVILVETSFQELYRGQPLFNDIYQFLLSKNFSYHGSFDQIFMRMNGEVLQADAIFIHG